MKRFEDLSEVHDFLRRIETCLQEEMRFGDFELKSGGSMGVAIYPQDAETADTLINNADLAMYRAKAALNQTICFYEVSMDEAARGRRALANDLWEAVERSELALHYQVQKSVTTGDVIGYEVLLRWNHPERGLVPPNEFIPLAEECGAILPIGEWVLRQACREAASWDAEYKIAVNLSPVQLANGDVVSLVHSILVETGLDAKRLELEITESTIIDDKERALLTLRAIKALGVTIAIDDFGTGYSSLETLRAFPSTRSSSTRASCRKSKAARKQRRSSAPSSRLAIACKFRCSPKGSRRRSSSTFCRRKAATRRRAIFSGDRHRSVRWSVSGPRPPDALRLRYGRISPPSFSCACLRNLGSPSPWAEEALARRGRGAAGSL